MNPNISQLHAIAAKPSRTIIGLMSGTSMDGLDIAVCEFRGSGCETKVDLKEFTTTSYTQSFKSELSSIFSKKMVDFEKVTLLNAWIAKQHAAMVLTALAEWGIPVGNIDLLASHGQTVYHAPKILHPTDQFGNATLQIGDGDHLAVDTGIITLSDFRQKHVAAGGEGAPLAVYGDYLLFSKAGENRVMLNIGGIANFTYLPGNLDATKIYSTDTGTGNTMMDAYVQKYFGIPYDRDSMIAKKGKVNKELLVALMDHEFFSKGFPKTIGPELFNLDYLAAAMNVIGVTHLAHEDVMATLNQFTAKTICQAIIASSVDNAPYVIYASGGGMHNPLLMQEIANLLPTVVIHTTHSLSINPDAKEALLFAILANEAVAGGRTPIGNGTKEIPSVSMGKISFPK